MSVLPALPVLLLGVFVIWFFWPSVADPMARAARRRRGDDRERLAEHLFETWSKRSDFASADRS